MRDEHSRLITAMSLVGLVFALGGGLGPATTHGQSAAAMSLRGMPTTAQVEAAISGPDPMDTAARRMGAFWQLRQIVNELAGPRYFRNQLTADEQRLIGEYHAGYVKANEPYAGIQKSPSHPDRPKWYKLHTFYEVDESFRNQLLNQFVPAAIRDAYLRAKGLSDSRALARSSAAAQARAQGGVQISADTNEAHPPEATTRSTPPQASGKPPVQAAAPGSPNRANAEAHKTRGDKYREANDYANAIAAYKQALALDPSHRSVLYLLAVTYSSAEQWLESVAAWDKWLATGANESPDEKASGLNLLGNAHRQLKHHDKAVETLHSAIALAPRPEILSSSHHFLGRTYSDLEQHEKAVAAYQEAVRVNPAQGSSYREMGVSLFGLRRNDQAVASLQQAIRLRPNDGLAYYDLGYIYLETGRKAEAVEIQQKLQSIDASRAQQLAAHIAKWTPGHEAYQAGWTQFNNHEYEKAIVSLLEAVKLDPTSRDAHMVLGEAYDRTMQFEKAAAAYKRALEVQPDHPYALRYLGTAYIMLGRRTEALEVHSRVAKIDKTSGELLLADINHPGGPAAILAGSAQSERIGGDEQTALEYLQNALRLKPTNPDALFEIGFAYELWDHFDEAAAAYRSVLDVRAAPDKIAEAHRRLGSMYNDIKEYAKALPELKEGLRIKTDSYTNRLIGDSYAGLRDYTSAIAAYQEAVRLKPDDADAHFGIGAAHLALKQYDQALGPFQEVARLEPKAARGFYEIGHTYFLMKRPLDAVSALTRATSVEPKHAQAHFGLGMAYRVVGRRDDAMREYETLKSLDAKLAEQLLNALNGPSRAARPSPRPPVKTPAR